MDLPEQGKAFPSNTYHLTPNTLYWRGIIAAWQQSFLQAASARAWASSKALLAMGESTLLQSLVTTFAGTGPVVVVLRQGQHMPVRGALVTRDVHPGAGPLVGCTRACRRHRTRRTSCSPAISKHQLNE